MTWAHDLNGLPSAGAQLLPEQLERALERSDRTLLAMREVARYEGGVIRCCRAEPESA